MSAPPLLPQQRREHPEPTERAEPVPWFLVVLLAALLSVGIAYIAQEEALETAAMLGDGRDPAELRGATAQAGARIDVAALYASRCAACHQAQGQGLPGVFPPLAGSEWVVGAEPVLVATVLHGVQGRLTVKGQAYEGSMPAFKDQLSDAELAALLSHLRGQWGNQAAPVTAEAVAQVRQASAARTQSFLGEAELAAWTP